MADVLQQTKTAKAAAVPTMTSLSILADPEEVRAARDVVAMTMPAVLQDTLEDAFAAALGASDAAGLDRLLALSGSLPAPRQHLFLDVRRLVSRLRVSGHGDADIGVLATDAASVLCRGSSGRFACSNPGCSYGAAAYSQEPAYRALFSDSTIRVPQDGCCLNCADDRHHGDEFGE